MENAIYIISAILALGYLVFSLISAFEPVGKILLDFILKKKLAYDEELNDKWHCNAKFHQVKRELIKQKKNLKKGGNYVF